jgi:hypothetical protein
MSAVAGALVAAAAIVIAAQAFAAPGGSRHGDSISGYVVSHVAYGFAGASISSVSFDLDASASSAKVELGGRWHVCEVASRHATCAGLAVPAAAADSLTVIARA